MYEIFSQTLSIESIELTFQELYSHLYVFSTGKMEKERLQFCINRFDHYYDSINNKVAVFLGLGTFVLGGTVATYPYLLQNVNCTFWIHISIGLPILLGLINLLMIISVSMPHLGKRGKSLFYFASISSMSKSTFYDQSASYSKESELTDLREQTRELSTGLSRKFQKLKIVGLLFRIQFILFIPLIILVIKNLKT